MFHLFLIVCHHLLNSCFTVARRNLEKVGLSSPGIAPECVLRGQDEKKNG